MFQGYQNTNLQVEDQELGLLADADTAGCSKTVGKAKFNKNKFKTTKSMLSLIVLLNLRYLLQLFHSKLR
jgi:hypothetical protein